MAYQIKLTNYAEKCLDECLDYLMYYVSGFGNMQAALNFLKEYEKTLNRLSESAHSFALCREKELRKLDERKIHFKRLRYKIFYHIENDIVITDLLCHDSRDYNKLFTRKKQD